MQYLDFGVFFVCQILAAGFSVDFRAVFALFDHFGQDGGDFGIVGFGAFVHFKLFDGGVDEADGAEETWSLARIAVFMSSVRRIFRLIMSSLGCRMETAGFDAV